jgi:hypothetical protein
VEPLVFYSFTIVGRPGRHRRVVVSRWGDARVFSVRDWWFGVGIWNHFSCKRRPFRSQARHIVVLCTGHHAGNRQFYLFSNQISRVISIFQPNSRSVLGTVGGYVGM